MARIGDTMPAEWATLPHDRLIEAIGLPTLFACMRDIEEYYNSYLPLWAVLSYYGTPVGPDDEKLQVSCRLPTHGSDDHNKSARYFAVDRDTERRIGGVYCWVCQKTYRAFRYTQVMEKASSDAKLTDVFRMIEGVFRIPFPRHILFGFDPDMHYTLTGGGRTRSDYGTRFGRARQIRETYRGVDDVAWVNCLLALYLEPVDAPQ